MSVITAADLTFNGEEVKALSETIITEFHKNPSLSEFHTLVKGIKARKQIAILGVLGLVGKKKAGSCSTSENAGTLPMTEKFWAPEYIVDRFAQCWEDLLETFFVWGLKNGVEKPDLTSTDFANFLNEQIGFAMEESVFRHAWFGDTDAANYNDSPAGVITNGVDPDYFNAIDGLWKQIFAIIATTPAQRVTIAANAEATYVLQKFDSTDTTNEVVTGYFQTMIDEADERLTAAGDLVIVCTKSMADQYKRERKKASGIDVAYTRVEKGIQSLEIDGVKVYVFSFWDRMIKAYFDNGTKYHLPHRAVLTTKSNLQIGTEEEGNLAELDPFYEKKEKKYYVDFGFNLDAKLIEDYKVMAAY
jgi:hypothetical protein